MKIAVCVKQVPDTAAYIRVRSDAMGIDTSGISPVMNPYDEYAVEEAIRIREANPGSEVTVVALGPKGADETVRQAIGMGADRGMRIAGEAEMDDLSAANAFAAALRDLSPDLILTGKEAVDDGSSPGPMIAEILSIPCVSAVVKLVIAGATATAHREVEGGTEIVEASLPAVITAEKGLNEPRYPALKQLIRAKKETIAEIPAQGAEDRLETVRIEAPPQREGGRIIGEGPDAAAELVRLLRERKIL